LSEMSRMLSPTTSIFLIHQISFTVQPLHGQMACDRGVGQLGSLDRVFPGACVHHSDL
jgi:hypothetical protein